MNINNIDYRSKYLKYKAKYVLLKELEGGGGEGEDMPTMASKMSSKITNAATSLNLMELNDLLPFIRELDRKAKDDKKQYKKQAQEAKKNAEVTSNAVSALEEVEQNPSVANVNRAKGAVEELELELASKPTGVKINKAQEAKDKFIQGNKLKADIVRAERNARKESRKSDDESLDKASNLFQTLTSDSETPTESDTNKALRLSAAEDRQRKQQQRGKDPKSIPSRR
jgi:hypothetical protein